MQIGTILGAIDLSRFSAEVVHHGVELARHFRARLILCHAVFHASDPLYRTTLFERGGEQQERIASAQNQIETMMQTQPVTWQAMVKVGEPVDVMARAAKEAQADLVIAASHGLRGLKRVFLGKVVERMARHIECPLLVVRPAPTEQSAIALEHILIACSLTTQADTVVGYGCRFAQHLNARMTLLHAMETPLNKEIVNPEEAPYTEVQDALARRLRQRMVTTIPEDMHAMAEPGYVLQPGLPGEAMLQYARRHAVDLIVVGVRAHRAMEKIVVGSTTEALLRHSPCPVLVVPEDLPQPGRVATDTADRLATGIVQDARMLEHLTADDHPESHQRLATAYAAVADLQRHPAFRLVPARMARSEEILWVHTPEHLAQVAATAEQPYSQLNPDTPASAASYIAARLAVGGLFQAVDRVVSGDLSNAFALVRPPGHHAEAGRAMGYCIFNNVALGALYAQRHFNLARVLIIDWDVHHGNGTQHVFERDPTVLFFSVHQYPHFPGTGSFTEVGIGPGEGYTVNVPLPGGYGDGEFVGIFQELLRPMALEFNPDLVLVSAGFDTHHGDPLGNMRLSPNGFSALTRTVMDIAADCCGGKLVLALEGGYHLEHLAASVKVVLHELANQTYSDPRKKMVEADAAKMEYVISRCKQVHRPYWRCWGAR
jgi:acetoin utilization deacetylase AcuC-like enzyme/nucleotide-binding universal stress UspA family protein